MPKLNKPYAEGWKFRSIDSNTFSTLINQELWFSNPSNFNDPFDCQIDIQGTFKAVEPYIEKHWPEDFTAFQEGIEEHADTNAYGYLCLCGTWEHTLMWSHYADNHRGIALGFNFDVESPIKITELEMKPIIYKSDAFKSAIKQLNDSFNFMKAHPLNTPSLASGEAMGFLHSFRKNWMRCYDIIRFMKAECWEYEKEIRFETELSNKTAPGITRPFSPNDLKHVVFGVNCSSNDQQTIQNLLRNNEWNHIQFWKAHKDPINLLIFLEKLN